MENAVFHEVRYSKVELNMNSNIDFKFHEIKDFSH